MPPSIHLALGLYFERTGGSRADYVKLREVLQLTEEPNSETVSDERLMASLPLKLDSLKRQVRRHIPLLELHRKALTVIVEKQPSLAARKKGQRSRQRIQRLVWIYWYEPINLIATILSATRLREKMHFGMAVYTDNPTELWNSSAWGSSIRAASGDVCFSRQGDLIVPGDFLQIVGDDEFNERKFSAGRVVFFGRDHRSPDSGYPGRGEVRLLMQPVVDSQHSLVEGIPDRDLDEVFLIEHLDFEVSLSSLHRHIDIFVDREYDDTDDDIGNSFTDGRTYVRRIFDYETSSIRPLCRSHPTRGELEVSYYGRQYVEEYFSRPHLSFPYLLFTDGFGVHRNMYRALKAFYLIPANLPYEERRKVANVFTLTLGPHGAAIADVVEPFSRAIRKMDKGCNLEINGESTEVCAFIISLIGDMPEMAENGGFAHHSAQKGCRSCFCPKNSRGDLDFDTVTNGRTHFETIRQREFAKQLVGDDLKVFLKDAGLRAEQPAMVRLCPALDLIQTRTYDAPHSEWRGLGRILHSFLVTTMLSKRGNTEYLKAFQNFQYPPGWPHIQSPTYYIGSWSLSEAGRASILLPLILRCHATVGWFRLPYLQAVERTMDIETSPLRAIVKAFGVIAHSNTLVGSQRYTPPDRLHSMIIRARKAYQSLIRCGIESGEGVSAVSRPSENKNLEGNVRQDDSDDSDNEMAEGKVTRDDNNDSEDETAEGNQMANVINAAIDSDSELDFQPILAVGTQARTAPPPKKRRGRKSKANKFSNLLSLPNVHAGLHLADNAREYSTVMNSNVLAGELKHMSAHIPIGQCHLPNVN